MWLIPEPLFNSISLAVKGKPLHLGYIYPSPMLVRVRENAITDYAPQDCLCTWFEKKLVLKHALTRKRVRALTRAAGKW